MPQPILLKEGQEFNFTIKRGLSTADTVSVNYDDFINDVDVGDIILVDGEKYSLYYIQLVYFPVICPHVIPSVACMVFLYCFRYLIYPLKVPSDQSH